MTILLSLVAVFCLQTETSYLDRVELDPVGETHRSQADQGTYELLKQYLTDPNAQLRRAAVLILCDSVLDEPMPHSLQPLKSRALLTLSEMRSSELGVLFDFCRNQWKAKTPADPKQSSSQYEQLHRIITVLKSVKSLDGFDFYSYVSPDELTVSRLALYGMALVYSDRYKNTLQELATGHSPLAQPARDALTLAGK